MNQIGIKKYLYEQPNIHEKTPRHLIQNKCIFIIKTFLSTFLSNYKINKYIEKMYKCINYERGREKNEEAMQEEETEKGGQRTTIRHKFPVNQPPASPETV